MKRRLDPLSVRRSVLYLLLDDAFLLGQVAYELAPEGSGPGKALEAADDAAPEAARMLEKGWIRVLKTTDPDGANDTEVLDLSRALAALLDRKNWEMPDRSTRETYSLEMTPAGQGELRRIASGPSGNGA
ncbi:MAG: hypothetical protein KGJ84_10145 [Elusimicrobia bacterium]|nr:hypothetical protein [Elusimicrobiota bacterium]